MAMAHKIHPYYATGINTMNDKLARKKISNCSLIKIEFVLLLIQDNASKLWKFLKITWL